MLLGTLVLLTTVGGGCAQSKAVSTQIPTHETPGPTESAQTPTAIQTFEPTLADVPTLTPTPEFTPTAGPTMAAILEEGKQAQGIFGTVLLVPGVCLPDPVDPNLCLNKPTPGRGRFDIRAWADAPDVGYSNAIVAILESGDDGRFRLELAPGEYCVWMGSSCEAQIEISPGRWSELTLQIYLP